MVAMYPHTFKYSAVASSAKDSNGDYTSVADNVTEYNCRFESYTESAFTKDKVEYTGLVYFPKGSYPFASGANCEVYNGEKLIEKNNIKRVYDGQFNTRVWL
jgi:hypothetical protein